MRDRVRRDWVASASLFALANVWVLAVPLAAQRGGELFGRLGGDARAFPSSPLSSAQSSAPSLSVMAEPGYGIHLGAEIAVSVVALMRADQNDPERTHVDLREALIRLDRGPLTVRFGVHTVFWGVTESRHLVNVVNQTDYLEDLGGDEKFGQPMVMVTRDLTDFGFLDVFVMTWSRPQLYPGEKGRPGVPVHVDYDGAVYEAGRERWHPDLALRWSHSVGPADWALSVFAGTTREPELIPPDPTVLIPRYDLIRQVGLEVQWTGDEWLWKAESIVRSGQGPLFAAVTGGFEYTTFGLLGSAVDVGTMLEYSYDGRDNLTFNMHDDDVFGGVRVSLNDVPGTELVAGVLWDVETDATYASVEASRRVGDRWRLELVGRAFQADDPEDPLYWFRRDDYVGMTLEYHF